MRLIGQHLTNIGLKTSAAVLMAEAGCKLDQPTAATFKMKVLSGDWAVAVKSKSYNMCLMHSIFPWVHYPRTCLSWTRSRSSIIIALDRTLTVLTEMFFPALDNLRDHLENPEKLSEMKYLLLEQKYLELLSQKNRIEALKVRDLTTRMVSIDRQLSS